MTNKKLLFFVTQPSSFKVYSLKEIMEYVDDNEDKFIDDLRRLCRQPSISTQNKGIWECVQLVKGMMEEVGIDARIIPVNNGFPVVFGELKSKRTSKTLGFYNHYDVQPPEPYGEWTTPPFEAKISEGKICARGVADNKGDLVARLKATEAILRTVGDIPVNLKFFVEGEEEIGSPHLGSFVKKNMDLLKADAYLWEGTGLDEKDRPTISLGVKGLMYVELKVKGANKDVHSMWSPLIVNPAWRLIWALGTIKDPDERIRIEGWCDDVREPTKEDIRLLKATPFEERIIKKNLGLKRFLGDLSGLEAVKSLCFNPTSNVCGIDSGYKGPSLKTILPCIAKAKVGFRMVPEQDSDDLLNKLKSHLRRHGFGDIEVKKLAGYEPSKTSPENTFARLVAHTIKEVYGIEPVVRPMSPGAGPMYTVKNWMGIPVVNGGGVGYAHSSIHAPNENIRLSDYMQSIEFLTTLISKFK